MKPPKNTKSSLDQDYAKLQTLLKEFDAGSLGLEESLSKYKVALSLASKIKTRLSEIQTEIQQLSNQK